MAASEILLQPDGTFAVWSERQSAIIIFDCTAEEIFNAELDAYSDRLRDMISKKCAGLKDGSIETSLTFDEAVARHIMIHGKFEEGNGKDEKQNSS